MAEQEKMASKIEVERAERVIREGLDKSKSITGEVTFELLVARERQKGMMLALQWVLGQENEMTEVYSHLIMEAMSPSVIKRGGGESPTIAQERADGTY